MEEEPNPSERPTCVLCQTPFSCSDDRYIPRVLVCGHTLCSACCHQISVMPPNQKEDEQHRSRWFSCPDCNLLTMSKDAEHLPKNWSVILNLKISNIHSNIHSNKEHFISSSLQHSPIQCENSEFKCTRQAVTYCWTCEVSFCQQCSDVIHNESHHDLICTHHELKPVAYRTPRCIHHPTCTVDYYCHQEKELYCMRCHAMGKHKNHSPHTVDISKEANKIRADSKKRFKAMNGCKARLQVELDTLMSNIQNLQLSSTTALSDIDEAFDNINKKLFERREQLKQQVHNIQQGKQVSFEACQELIVETQLKSEEYLCKEEQYLTHLDEINDAEVVARFSIAASQTSEGRLAPPMAASEAPRAAATLVKAATTAPALAATTTTTAAAAAAAAAAGEGLVGEEVETHKSSAVAETYELASYFESVKSECEERLKCEQVFDNKIPHLVQFSSLSAPVLEKAIAGFGSLYRPERPKNVQAQFNIETFSIKLTWDPVQFDPPIFNYAIAVKCCSNTGTISTSDGSVDKSRSDGEQEGSKSPCEVTIANTQLGEELLFDKLYSGEASEYTFTSDMIKPDCTYSFKVRADSAIGSSDWSCDEDHRPTSYLQTLTPSFAQPNTTFSSSKTVPPLAQVITPTKPHWLIPLNSKILLPESHLFGPRIIKLFNGHTDFKLNLLYSGSRDGFHAKQFHDKCDGSSSSFKTFVVIKSLKLDDTPSGKECAYISGGFTSQSWSGRKEHINLTNDIDNFWIFSLYPTFVKLLCGKHKAYQSCDPNYGPIFGPHPAAGSNFNSGGDNELHQKSVNERPILDQVFAFARDGGQQQQHQHDICISSSMLALTNTSEINSYSVLAPGFDKDHSNPTTFSQSPNNKISLEKEREEVEFHRANNITENSSRSNGSTTASDCKKAMNVLDTVALLQGGELKGKSLFGNRHFAVSEIEVFEVIAI